MLPHRDAGSFRDPAGFVYDHEGDIVRTVRQSAVADYEFVRQSGALRKLIDLGWLIESEEVDPSAFVQDDPSVRYLLRHPRIPFISYPYEWSFGALQAAALLQLDFHMAALDDQVTLSDAPAYNIQFRGPRPVHIDVLSLRRYRDGEIWSGHRQFCEQFLNPLLMRALFGVPHNAWFRGKLDGVPATDLAPFLRLRHCLSWTVLSHVYLQAHMQRKAEGGRLTRHAQRVRLSKNSMRAMLVILRNYIAKLRPKSVGNTVWADYARTHTYERQEEAAKRELVARLCAAHRPSLVLDIGCNTGEYAKVALDAGARAVIGFDADHGALDTAFEQARRQDLNFLPLYQDFADPSPDQGWRQGERKGFSERAQADFVLALAVEHHLAIAHNIPLPSIVEWLVGLAPRGIIEFVEKSDPTIRQMLTLRQDIFADYSPDAFVQALGKVARIEEVRTISATGRKLFVFHRA